MAKPSFWSRMGAWLTGKREPAAARLLEAMGADGQAGQASPKPLALARAAAQPGRGLRLLTDDGRQVIEVTPADGKTTLDDSATVRIRRRRRARRDYESAGQGRNNAGWWAPNTAANVEVRKSLPILRARCRDLVRNNAHAKRAIDVLVTNLVGQGHTPRSNTGDPKLDKRVNDLWRKWAPFADPFHELDVYGVQALAVQTWLEGGEAIVRRRVRRLDDGLPVPMQLELLEGDLLDSWRTGDLPNGGRIVQGVEFDPINRRAAYWLLPQHPGDQLFGRATGILFGGGSTDGSAIAEGLTSRPIPKSEVAHLYKPTRAGQVRGVPWLATVAQDIRDIDDYSYAERVRKRLEACLVAFVIGDTPSDRPPDQDGIAPSVDDSDGNPVEEFTPGMIARVTDGKDVRVHAPAASPGYGEYKKTELQEVAVGAGVTYEQLTGDLSNVSFASYRVGRVELFGALRQLHRLTLIPKLYQPIWQWFTDTAQAAGLIPVRADGYPCKWPDLRFESIERDKDAGADKLELRNGTRSLFDVIASYGRDPEETLAEVARAFELLDELGLVLDVDPRRTVAAGSAAGGAVGPAAGAESADSADSADSQSSNQADASSVQAAAVQAADSGNVQASALNGAQVTALVDVIDRVSNGTLSDAAAKALIAASFPAFTSEVIDKMVDSAVVKTPAADSAADSAATATDTNA